MNRSLINVLFGGIAAPSESAKKIEGVVTKVRYVDRARPQGLTFGKTSVEETVEALLDAETVIITPGYGLAVAKAVRFPLIAYMVHLIRDPLAICHCRNGQASYSSRGQGPIRRPSR